MPSSPHSAKTSPEALTPLQVHEHYSESGRWGSFVSQSPYYEDSLASLPDEAFKDKVIAVTGCTSGCGFHIARAATIKGARGVLLLNRPSPRSAACEEALISLAPDGTHVCAVDCDLSSFDSVQKAALTVEMKSREWKGASGGGLDVLVNNAAVAWQPDERTENGLEVQMQTNHLSHVLLVNLLLPSLEERAELRIEETALSPARSPKGRNMFHRANSSISDGAHSQDIDMDRMAHDGCLLAHYAADRGLLRAI